jgi:hypothetical protein
MRNRTDQRPASLAPTFLADASTQALALSRCPPRARKIGAKWLSLGDQVDRISACARAGQITDAAATLLTGAPVDILTLQVDDLGTIATAGGSCQEMEPAVDFAVHARVAPTARQDPAKLAGPQRPFLPPARGSSTTKDQPLSLPRLLFGLAGDVRPRREAPTGGELTRFHAVGSWA